MKTDIEKLTMIWQDITIHITYNPDYSESTKEIMGFRLVHLEMETEERTPLPFTESGYRSHFSNATEIEKYGTPVDFVQAWLDETSKNKKWQKYLQQSKQLRLF